MLKAMTIRQGRLAEPINTQRFTSRRTKWIFAALVVLSLADVLAVAALRPSAVQGHGVRAARLLTWAIGAILMLGIERYMFYIPDGKI